MVNTKSAMGKKRSATTKIQSKPAKAAKTEEPVQEIEDQGKVEIVQSKKAVLTEFYPAEKKQIEGLFDNLDEEMDPTVLDDIMNQMNDDSQSEEEEDIEEEEDVEEEGDKMDEDDQEVPASLEQKSTAKRFRDSYMTKVTQAFGSDLDIIRQEPNLNGPRLNILIDSLEAGIDIFSTLEQEIILADEEK